MNSIEFLLFWFFGLPFIILITLFIIIHIQFTQKEINERLAAQKEEEGQAPRTVRKNKEDE